MIITSLEKLVSHTSTERGDVLNTIFLYRTNIKFTFLPKVPGISPYDAQVYDAVFTYYKALDRLARRNAINEVRYFRKYKIKSSVLPN